MKSFAVILFVLMSSLVWSQADAIIDTTIEKTVAPEGELVIVVEGQRVATITDFQPNYVSSNYLHTAIRPERSAFSLGRNPKAYVNSRRFFSVRPLCESYVSFDSALNYRASVGVGMNIQTQRWYNRTQFLSGWSDRETVDQDHAPFLPQHNRSQYWYNGFRTRTHFMASNNLDISFGLDNHFIGDGYRSILLSNQNAPAPFVMIRANFWKLEYGLLYQGYHENDTAGMIWKFNALHYLSWNATKNFNITLLEQVLFQPKDGPFNRGFELEYLNPIVFFRPQEYSLGSSDNVILGLQTSYKIGNHKIYGQLSLDEFVLKEIRNRTQWWANKYGAQLGVKGVVKQFNYLVEGSFIRPYTFSHVNDGQSVGNLHLPAAHPLGSNFCELLTNVSYRGRSKVMYKAIVAFQLKGYDSDSVSWGGDIYRSYVLRAKEYGNTIGQGTTVRSLVFGLQTSYGLIKVPFEFYIQLGGSYYWGEIQSQFTPTAVAGVRSPLFQARKML